MKKERFKKIATQAGFDIKKCGDGEERVFWQIPHEPTCYELERFQNLLLDEVIKELNSLSGDIGFGSATNAIDQAIEKIEAMKCN